LKTPIQIRNSSEAAKRTSWGALSLMLLNLSCEVVSTLLDGEGGG